MSHMTTAIAVAVDGVTAVAAAAGCDGPGGWGEVILC